MRSPWVWVIWLLVIAFTFAVIEGLAVSDPGGLTLSQFIVNVSRAWPPIVALIGILIGMLISHFWWPWIPKQHRDRCEICGRDVLKP